MGGNRPIPGRLVKERKIRVNGCTLSIVRLYILIREGYQLPNLFRYLFSYFLWSDGLSTLVTCGILFAQDELKMKENELSYMVLELQISAVIGAFLFTFIQNKMNYNSKQMLLLHIFILSL